MNETPTTETESDTMTERVILNYGFDVSRCPQDEHLNEPRCPQCGATSRWVNQEVAAECDPCDARWTETATTTERTAR